MHSWPPPPPGDDDDLLQLRGETRGPKAGPGAGAGNEAEAPSEGAVARRGASAVMRAMAELFGEDLLEQVPKVSWRRSPGNYLNLLVMHALRCMCGWLIYQHLERSI